MTKHAKRNAVSETDAWIKHEIQKLAMVWKKGEADWRVIADHLLSWEESLSRGEASASRHDFFEDSEIQIRRPAAGLGKYVKQLAEVMNIQASNLWRYRKAALAARIIWSDRSMNSPLDIPDHASPESIELVEKIFRAAPLMVAEDVAKRLYDNEITRADLRRIWQDIRQAVEGSKKPFVDQYRKMSDDDSVRIAALFENLCFEALRNSLQGEDKESVLGAAGICFRGVEVEGARVGILAATEDVKDHLCFHAIETLQSFGAVARDRLQHLCSWFDKVWVAVPEEMLAATEDFMRSLPEGVGILMYEKGTGTLKVHRSAVRNPDLDAYVLRYLTALLLNLTG